MTKRMLIDATHAEETRVVVLDGNRLEDFDVETATRKQLKGNIYLAKVVRVEPSLQAAFVEYGGGRHGFLAFGEIHPDYYQIPVADRQRLLELQAQEAREEAEAEEAAAAGTEPAAPAADELPPDPALAPGAEAVQPEAPEVQPAPAPSWAEVQPAPAEVQPEDPAAEPEAEPVPAQPAAIAVEERSALLAEPAEAEAFDPETAPPLPPPETVGGEAADGEGAEEARARRVSRILRNYRIQEVIRRRQIMLVQVVKEERGTKGAALTTYISLAGRFCVLMPNSPRGGGISRKITSAADRRRLKDIMAELEIPEGMGLIVRTAGANRPKAEIKRDCEYLMRLWDDIREHTLRSIAPALIYEEASLIKRAIRDVYSRDIDEVIVDGEEGWRAAHDFMRMLMPTHAKKVQLWRGDGGGPALPLFAKHQVEAQLDAMLAPTVQLRSGGYLVINQTEALVAIDVNSGRSTRERGIEETALRTNLEAAEEVARQLRLRDLAGLIVIDFIDMEAKKHNAMVEKRLKEALKTDRARLQVGHISHFGLLEMSRQRLRPSLAETSLSPCPHCGGTGHVRSVESSAIHALRAIEEEATKGRAGALRVHVSAAVALYLLNHKRDRLGAIEARWGVRVTFEPDESLIPPQIRIERLKLPETERAAAMPVAPAAPTQPAAEVEAPAEAVEEAAEAEAEAGEAESDATHAAAGEDAERRHRRRRRRRGGRREAPGAEASSVAAEAEPAAAPVDPGAAEQPQVEAPELEEEAEGRGRRRGRRGGRRRRRITPALAEPVAAPPPPYSGPTPAEPFGGGAFDLFDMIEAEPEPEPVAPAAPPSIPMAAETAPEFIAPAPAEHDAQAEPALAATPAVQAAAAAERREPALATAGTESAAAEPEPAIKPIIISESEPVAERKRGWWRR
jgi:ribonuclease E